jgi:arylsulfatase A-like enzyme
MVTQLSRREFIKLFSLLPIYYSAPRFGNLEISKTEKDTPNILIIVFDAFSAYHIPFLGYPRNTTPNLNRLIERGTVYHNHYAAGNFTTPGTASILTGTYPWTHRAFRINNEVHEDYQSRNIFHLLDDFHRITYSHNSLVNILQKQFTDDIDLYIPRGDLTFGGNKFLSALFKKDEDAATVSWARMITEEDGEFSSSLFISHLINYVQKKLTTGLEKKFPLGLPKAGLESFTLEDAINLLTANMDQFPQPFLGYFHFMPPHAPYATRSDFFGEFNYDHLHIKRKPKHPLAKPGKAKIPTDLSQYRQAYDEFILYVDAEFNRLFSDLEQSGLVDNTLLILTSDHGELFERGIWGHTTPSLHNPVVKIPLLIFEPGQEKRKDIYTPTSAVDILPTLLHILGRSIPSWSEGLVLPPYKDMPEDRSIYALEAKMNKPNKKVETGSALILKGKYKLTNYFGYKFLPNEDPLVELYDLENDPEEFSDISAKHRVLVTRLKEEVMAKIENADSQFGFE